MADLDDFFKKRDKKKKPSGKTTSKFTKVNPEEFIKKLELVNTLNPDVEQTDESSYVFVENANTIANEISTLTVSSAIPESAKTHVVSAPTNNKHDHNGDEEWKPFESDENKDYSGLRVNILQKWKKEGVEEDEENEISSEQDKKQNCPWTMKQSNTATSLNENEDEQQSSPADENKNEKTSTTATTTTTSATKSVEQTDKVEPTTTTTTTTVTINVASSEAGTGKAYVPPHLRGQATSTQNAPPPPPPTTTTAAPAASAGKYVPPSMRGAQSGTSTTSTSENFKTVTKKINRNQPNINDICEFPTLGDTPTSEPPKATNENKFEEPKRVAKVDTSNQKDNSIDLENRYNALSSASS